MDLISVLGSIASLWGAWFAWKQAKESQLAASLAERIKNQLMHHRDIENISKLEPLLKVAINKMRKYSVNRGEDSAGFSPNFDADHVQEYINEVYAYADYFPENKAHELYSKVNTLIQGFVNSQNDADRKKLGNDIHNELVAFSYIFNQIKKTYQSHTDEM
ncbi:hypothetical protein ETN89_20545 (plasmid) [Photobacterium damselae subsp. damselae]|uniref:hypothetical protein n=1 Tax=Photobacterium damselae TaxID=38293 RepID=UPI000A2FE82E|nr:hypothetical protein [Photobacterium damselae]ARR51891.1 hypothetical protein CAY62_21060 [Photobacterium damselae subsp. damselae]QAY37624.1 hypothetical protein ETN89_20545 [Photobacterium damselae subsp. damselae]